MPYTASVKDGVAPELIKYGGQELQKAFMGCFKKYGILEEYQRIRTLVL